ncbi:MAG: cytochrome c [Gammaproteobacteria bacterium]|nr:cytochrome c [Gammaproteobacteria bacterium]
MIRLQLWVALLSISFFIPHLQAKELDGVLPDSLSKWYKPENKRQVWLHTMFGMRRELQAVEEYVDQKDINGINKWSERLVTHYRKLPVMVPEWKEYVDLDAVDALDQAVKNSEFKSIRYNLRQLQKTCRSCHKKNRILATLRYRSPDFSSLIITGEDKEHKYPRFMKTISRSLNRIRIAAEDEHWSVASDASNQFQQELKMLGNNCASCHKDDEPVERILGASTKHSIDEMDAAIVEKNIRSVKMSLGETAVKVCARCHGVHRTAADIRNQLLAED